MRFWCFGSRAGKLDPDEYYYYGLHDDERYSLSDKKRFIGLRAGIEINDLLNHREWRGVANDKLVLYSILQGIGLPSPEIYAIYRPLSGFFSAVPSLTNTDSLKVFLRNQIRYPFFAKLVEGAFGTGAVAVKAYEKPRIKLHFLMRIEWVLEELVRTIDSGSATGYLFQEYLMPHPDIKKICGECLSTVRFNIFLTGGRPFIISLLLEDPNRQEHDRQLLKRKNRQSIGVCKS